MDRKALQEKKAEYETQAEQLRANLIATQGAIQAIEQLITDWGRSEKPPVEK